jgi:hypothetical protein
VEGWHGAINCKMEISHPNLGRFISNLKDEENIHKLNITRAVDGNFEIAKMNYKIEEKLIVRVS